MVHNGDMNEITSVTTTTVSAELVVAVVTSLAAIVAAFVPRLSSKDRRMKLVSDLEILDKLEEDSAARAALKASIERRILASSDTGVKTRDWAGFSIGALFIVLGVILLPFVNSLGGVWLVLHSVTALLLFFGVFGAISSVIKKPRDEKGNAIKDGPVEE